MQQKGSCRFSPGSDGLVHPQTIIAGRIVLNTNGQKHRNWLQSCRMCSVPWGQKKQTRFGCQIPKSERPIAPGLKHISLTCFKQNHTSEVSDNFIAPAVEAKLLLHAVGSLQKYPGLAAFCSPPKSLTFSLMENSLVGKRFKS